MVRLGIGLYGIDSTQMGKQDLHQVSTLRSTIAQLRSVREGETISYGRQGMVTRDSVIATVRLGYADGYPRSLSNGQGKMLVNGLLAPIIGAICMDMTMIDVTDIPGVKEGDDVIVFGKDLPVQQVAHWANTIPYEILTGVSQRVKRVYFQG
jgi:alanine racemase